MATPVKKDLEYYRQNAEDNLMTTPISVIRYISELEDALRQKPMSGNVSLIDLCKFAEWIAERYNYIGGEWCCWCAKQYDIKNTERYKDTGELFKYWSENCR